MSRASSHSSAGAKATQFEEPSATKGQSDPRADSSGQRRYLAGDIIADRYRLERKLGEGGMGVVWVAHSLVLDVDVALKLIRASTTSGGVASRMAREAHAAAKVAHPALVRVFDFGWTNHGDPFLVMELAQGETLDSVLEREVTIGAIRAVQVLLPLADGLRCAHEKGVIHRDVKPENVFLASDPFGRLQPKLLDFGIAKTEHQSQDNRLTRAGAVLGSPEFMSPEQARGQLDVDERTDVWSMCVMLYEMITGVLPFQKDNYNALMQSILQDSPTPSHQLEAGDEGLWLVISRGLQKDPDDRWESMMELGEALALWLYEHGVKEDVSGNSVRALWLDGSLCGVHAGPTTSPPPSLHKSFRNSWLSRSATTDAARPHVLIRNRNLFASRSVATLVIACVAALFGILTTYVLTAPDSPANASEHRSDIRRIGESGVVAPVHSGILTTAQRAVTGHNPVELKPEEEAPSAAVAPAVGRNVARATLSAAAMPTARSVAEAPSSAPVKSAPRRAPAAARRSRESPDFGF